MSFGTKRVNECMGGSSSKRSRNNEEHWNNDEFLRSITPESYDILIEYYQNQIQELEKVVKKLKAYQGVADTVEMATLNNLKIDPLTRDPIIELFDKTVSLDNFGHLKVDSVPKDKVYMIETGAHPQGITAPSRELDLTKYNIAPLKIFMKKETHDYLSTSYRKLEKTWQSVLKTHCSKPWEAEAMKKAAQSFHTLDRIMINCMRQTSDNPPRFELMKFDEIVVEVNTSNIALEIERKYLDELKTTLFMRAGSRDEPEQAVANEAAALNQLGLAAMKMVERAAQYFIRKLVLRMLNIAEGGREPTAGELANLGLRSLPTTEAIMTSTYSKTAPNPGHESGRFLPLDGLDNLVNFTTEELATVHAIDKNRFERLQEIQDEYLKMKNKFIRQVRNEQPISIVDDAGQAASNGGAARNFDPSHATTADDEEIEQIEDRLARARGLSERDNDDSVDYAEDMLAGSSPEYSPPRPESPEY